MADPALLVKSVLIGLAVAAPLGPVGALCIQRTLAQGMLAGLAGGLGTALADALYASLAASGFAAFSSILTPFNQPLRLVGGAFLIWFGWQSLRQRPAQATAPLKAGDHAGTLGATFLLTMVNPATILFFAAIFAGLGLGEMVSGVEAAIVVGGVFLGSMGWWLVLSGGVSLLKRRLPDGFAKGVGFFSGLIIMAFGMGAIISGLLAA